MEKKNKAERVSFKNGNQYFVNVLKYFVSSLDIRLGKECKNIRMLDSSLKVDFGKQSEEFDLVISTLNIENMAKITGIPFMNSQKSHGAIAHFGYEDSKKVGVEGAGYYFADNGELLKVDSHSWKKQNSLSVYFKVDNILSRHDILDKGLTALEKLGVTCPPSVVAVHFEERKYPKYTPGYSLESIKTEARIKESYNDRLFMTFPQIHYNSFDYSLMPALSLPIELIDICSEIRQRNMKYVVLEATEKGKNK
jgi:protoporphyrinogen oxidase